MRKRLTGRGRPSSVAVGVLLLDRPDRGGRGEQRLDAVLRDHPPERAGVRGADRLALVEHGRRAGDQRRVDDVGVADDPADVGGGPPHLARRGCRRCSAATRPSRPRGRRCRGRCPSACRSCRRCRGRRAGRWPRPRRTRRGRCAPAFIARSQSTSRPSTMAASACGRCLTTHGAGLVLGELEGPVQRAACTPPPGSARCRTRPRRRPWAGRRRCGPRARAAANPPKTTECTAPIRAHASIAIDRLGDHRHVDDDPVALSRRRGRAGAPANAATCSSSCGVGVASLVVPVTGAVVDQRRAGRRGR